MFERFTQGAIKTIMLAQNNAIKLQRNRVDSEQLLVGLIGELEGIGAKALASIGVTWDAVQAEVEKFIGQGSDVMAVEIPFTDSAKRALELSWDEARIVRDKHIGTEHLLLALIREGGTATKILDDMGVDQAELRAEVIKMMQAARDA